MYKTLEDVEAANFFWALHDLMKWRSRQKSQDIAQSIEKCIIEELEANGGNSKQYSEDFHYSQLALLQRASWLKKV